MAEIVLYEHVNGGGNSLRLFNDDPNLTNNQRGFWPWDNWNDQVSSVQVLDGTWKLYEHVAYQGHSLTLGEGFHNLTDYFGWNDMVSSVDYLWG